MNGPIQFAIGILIGIGLSIIACSIAHASDANYCSAYAKDLARILIPFVIRRAEATCGNAETEPGPPLPATWIAALHIVDPDFVAPGSVPATVGPSGFAPGSSDWNAWCRRVFPGSFDQKTGTIIFEPDNKGSRVKCPG